jgi:hypothetical protein
MQFEMDCLSARHNMVNMFEIPVFANEEFVVISYCFF